MDQGVCLDDCRSRWPATRSDDCPAADTGLPDRVMANADAWLLKGRVKREVIPDAADGGVLLPVLDSVRKPSGMVEGTSRELRQIKVVLTD